MKPIPDIEGIERLIAAARGVEPKPNRFAKFSTRAIRLVLICAAIGTAFGVVGAVAHRVFVWLA